MILVVDGNVELSPEANAVLDELLESLSSVVGEVKLKLKIKKNSADSEVEVTEKIEGELTGDQVVLWTELYDLSLALVKEFEGKAELEIEVEHELEAVEEPEEEEEEEEEEE